MQHCDGVFRKSIPKRVKVIAGWRKLHNEKRHSLYSSSNVVEIIRSRNRITIQVDLTHAHRNSGVRAGGTKNCGPEHWATDIHQDLFVTILLASCKKYVF